MNYEISSQESLLHFLSYLINYKMNFNDVILMNPCHSGNISQIDSRVPIPYTFYLKKAKTTLNVKQGVLKPSYKVYIFNKFYLSIKYDFASVGYITLYSL